MKKLISILAHLIACPLLCFSQRYSQERIYDIVGVADGDEVLESLKLGIPLLAVGFLIAYFSMWRKPDKETQNSSGTAIGCIGLIIMAVGFFMLIPLWTWVEAIGMTLISVAFGLAIIFAIIYFIYNSFKKK